MSHEKRQGWAPRSGAIWIWLNIPRLWHGKKLIGFNSLSHIRLCVCRKKDEREDQGEKWKENIFWKKEKETCKKRDNSREEKRKERTRESNKDRKREEKREKRKPPVCSKRLRVYGQYVSVWTEQARILGHSVEVIRRRFEKKRSFLWVTITTTRNEKTPTPHLHTTHNTTWVISHQTSVQFFVSYLQKVMFCNFLNLLFSNKNCNACNLLQSLFSILFPISTCIYLVSHIKGEKFFAILGVIYEKKRVQFFKDIIKKGSILSVVSQKSSMMWVIFKKEEFNFFRKFNLVSPFSLYFWKKKVFFSFK